MPITFPTEADFKRIGTTFSLDNLRLKLDDFQHKMPASRDFEALHITTELIPWINSFNERIFHTRRSYIFATFYFEQGIPDDEYFISSDENETSLEYFPHFDNEKYLIKDYFDYFVDVFYYKAFSSWDTIGHILTLLYHLPIRKPDFEKAVDKLASLDSTLHANLTSITKDSAYLEAKRLRNDITHNRPPGVLGSGLVQVTPTMSYMGVGQYTSSKQVNGNVNEIFALMNQTVAYLKQ